MQIVPPISPLKYMQSNHDRLMKVLIVGEFLNAVELSVMCFYLTANQPKKPSNDMNNITSN